MNICFKCGCNNSVAFVLVKAVTFSSLNEPSGAFSRALSGVPFFALLVKASTTFSKFSFCFSDVNNFSTSDKTEK